MFLEAGDRVPADGILIAAENAVFDESAMTGESDKLKKTAERPFIISGSEMVGGSVTMVVVGVGPNSVSGRAMALLSAESPSTPLQLKLEHLATQVSKLGAFVGIICFVVMTIQSVVEYANDEDPDKSGYGSMGKDPQCFYHRCDCARRRHPRRSASGRDYLPRLLRWQDDEGQHPRQASQRLRDDGWGHHDLHGQDGHAHAKQNDGCADVGAVG